MTKQIKESLLFSDIYTVKVGFLILMFVAYANAMAQVKPIQILAIDPSRSEVLITNDDVRRCDEGDRFCFYRNEIEVGCGNVVATSPFDATVKLSSSTDLVRTEKTETDNQNESFVELVFEKIELAKSDRVEFKGAAEKTPTDLTNQTLLEGLVQLRRSIASKQDAFFGKEDLLIEVERKARDPEEGYHHGLLSNVSAGFNYIFPTVSYQQHIWGKLVMGVSPVLINSPTTTGSVGGYGLYLSLAHYGREPFAGDWLQLGLGFMQISAGDISWNSPAASLTAGWRWFWDGGVNFGLGGGVQYLIGAPPANSRVEFSGLMPSLILDVGFAF